MTSLGVVDGGTWSQNSVASATGGVVKLTTGGGGSDIGNLIWTGTAFTLLEGIFHIQIQLVDGAPELGDLSLGFVDGAASTSTATSLFAATGFSGINWHYGNNPYNMRPIVNGTVQTATGNAPGKDGVAMAANTYYDWYLSITYVGANIVLKLYRDSPIKVNLRNTSSVTAPVGLTSLRPAIGWNSGFGFTTDVWVTGNPEWITDPSTYSILNLIGYGGPATADIYWDQHPLANSYDYRVNGGSVSSVTDSANPTVHLTSLTNGTTYTVEVRPVTSAGVGTWASTTVTPTSTSMFDDFQRTNVTPSTTALGTSSSGAAWTQPSGSLGILNGYAYTTSSAENLAIATGIGPDQDVSVLDTQGVYNNGLIFRYRDTNNYWLWEYEQSTLRLYRKIAGGFAIYVPLTRTWLAGDTYRAIAVGNHITLMVNGAIWAKLEDTFYVAGTDTSAGFRLAQNPGSIGSFFAGPATATTVPVRDATPNGAISAPAMLSGSAPIYLNGASGHVYKGRDTTALDSAGVV